VRQVGDWDYTADVVVVGSGGGGLTAALMASDLGSRVLVVEKSDQYGGSTAMSGGSIWAPNNPLLERAGSPDSPEAALAYLRAITSGGVSEERLRAFVEGVSEMVRYLEEHSRVRFQIVPGYPDYYTEVEGSRPNGGRTLETVPLNARHLKGMWKQLRAPPAQEVVWGGWMLTATEARVMLSASLRARLISGWRFASYLLNPARSLSRTDTRLTLGSALVGRLRLSLADRRVPLWLETRVRGLTVEGGRVRGVEAEREGRTIRVRAAKGVILASGGFEKSQAMRERYQRPPVCADWSNGSPDNTGDGIRMGIEAGAAVGLMDQAWWMPTAMIPGGSMPWYSKGAWWTEIARKPGSSLPWFILVDRSLPGTIMVNSKGRRFTNEAAPYLDVANAQFANHTRECSAIPAYLIADQRYHRRYPMGPVMPGLSTQKYVKSGFLKASNSLRGLAEQCGIDAAGLEAEVERYNRHAVAGRDLDFHKGETPIDRFYGEPAIEPNPCLAPLCKPPYYAIESFPGDLGTKGGLCTDSHARVLREDGSPIEGLYATGNCSASVMGETYAGAGATIGPSMTFGYLAARHASGD
jgi:3-oxosteroid 1-dehydrogenase